MLPDYKSGRTIKPDRILRGLKINLLSRRICNPGQPDIGFLTRLDIVLIENPLLNAPRLQIGEDDQTQPGSVRVGAQPCRAGFVIRGSRTPGF